MIRGQFCCRDDGAVVSRYTKTRFGRRRRKKDEDVILTATSKKSGNSPSVNTVRSVSTLSTGTLSRTSRKNGIEQEIEFLAPSVHHLKTLLLRYLKENGLGPSTKVHDAKNVLRKATPIRVSTRNKGESKPYADCIGIHNEDHAGKATHMLCYTWTFTFGSIIDALSNYCKKNGLDPRRTYVWIDCLCTVLNRNSEQQEQSHSTFEEFESAFTKRMKSIPNVVVVVMTPWNDPRCLKRMWCLLEIFYAISNKKVNIDIAVPSKEYYQFLKTLRRGCQDSTSNIGIDELFNIITSIAIERSSSSVTSDMQHILDLVNKIGPNKVNATIITFMKKWMLDTIRIGLDKVESECKNYLREEQVEMRGNIALFVDFIARYLSDYGDHKEALYFYQKQFFILKNAQVKYMFRAKISSCLLNMGTEYCILGDFENALKKFQEALLIREEVYGIDHEKTGSVYLKIGGTLKSLGEIDEALNFINKAIFIYENLCGDKCNELVLAYDYAGRIHRCRGDPKETHALYTKSLEVQSNQYGRSHPNIGTCHYSIGIASYEMGNYESAIFHYKNVMSIYTSVYGMEHPYTAGSYYNLGRTYYANGEFENALTHFSISNKAYRTTYGESHVDTLDAKKWMIIAKKTLAEPKLYSKVEI